MAHQRRVAPRQVLLGIGCEVAEGCRQVIVAMLLRHATEAPERVLQALVQRHEALAAEHDLGMLEARECEPEVIEPMVQSRIGRRVPLKRGEARQPRAQDDVQHRRFRPPCVKESKRRHEDCERGMQGRGALGRRVAEFQRRRRNQPHDSG